MSSSWGPIFGTGGGYFPTENDTPSTPTPKPTPAPAPSCWGPVFGDPGYFPNGNSSSGTSTPTPRPTPTPTTSLTEYNLYTESGHDEPDGSQETSKKVEAASSQILGQGSNGNNTSGSSTTNS